MTDKRYFIINNRDSFQNCILQGMRIEDNSLVSNSDDEKHYLLTPLLDCGEQKNRWQRLLADLDIPTDYHVAWRFFVTDIVYEGQGLELLLSDASLSVAEKVMAMKRFEAYSVENATDFLLMEVTGRYLVVFAEFSHKSSVALSPVILRAVTVFSAWDSFLKYLPELFREEGSFLDRFLKLFSVEYLDLENRIESLPKNFDPRLAPPEILYWLAEIIGIPYIGLWNADNLRKLLVSGTYRKKGRLLALPELVEIFTGFRPYVVENFRMRTGKKENDNHYANTCISLFMPPEALEANLNPEALRLVIESFLPAGVTYTVLTLDKFPVLSGYAYLGINARLGRYVEAELGINSRLNYVMLGGSAYAE